MDAIRYPNDSRPGGRLEEDVNRSDTPKLARRDARTAIGRLGRLKRRSGRLITRRETPSRTLQPLRGALWMLTPILSIPLAAGSVAARQPLQDVPVVWHEDDRRDIPEPAEREPNLLRDGIDETGFQPLGRLVNPGRLARRVGGLFGGDHAPPASNVNSLDEVPNSAWFTNRIGLYALGPDQAARGPMTDDGPDPSRKWTVVSAKTEGVTPGFNIRDGRGMTYLIKFDPPGDLGTSSAAGVITGRILHAAGYNVPEDAVVRFRREDLVLGEKVRIKLPDGSRRMMTEQDLEDILAKVDPLEPGVWLAISSKFLPGEPLGPFNYRGRRKDDPNDRLNHEHRRELRALRVFCSWLSHYDTKQHNSLDTFVEEGGRHFVRHHLIDFASTLGAGASGAFPAYNYEHSFDFSAILGRTLALGLHEDAWRRLRRPEGLPEIGYFESKIYDPLEFKPLTPNPAFANCTDRDGYWAAKIISAFSDEILRSIVSEGKYRDPAAGEYMAKTLAERRNKLCRAWFDRATPLDFFTVQNGVLQYRDLGHERDIYPGTVPSYRVRGAAVSPVRKAAEWSPWVESRTTEVNLDSGPVAYVASSASPSEYPFIAVECQVHRGQSWSDPVTAYVARKSRRVVAVDR
jgi:hypothetical protein